MTRKTALKVILAAAVMPRIDAQEKATPNILAGINSIDKILVTQPKDYTISFSPALERLHIEVAGKRFTFTPQELADALGS
jgi:hypothetical protein